MAKKVRLRKNFKTLNRSKSSIGISISASFRKGMKSVKKRNRFAKLSRRS